MTSMIFNNALLNEAKGLIDYDSDTFGVMLVTSAYTPDKDAHAYRSDVTNEVVGTGYTAGGKLATLAVTLNTAFDRVDVTLGGTSWPTATISARGAVYYKNRGGASNVDEIVAYIDFAADVTSTAGTFNLTASTLRKQN